MVREYFEGSLNEPSSLEENIVNFLVGIVMLEDFSIRHPLQGHVPSSPLAHTSTVTVSDSREFNGFTMSLPFKSSTFYPSVADKFT